LAGLVLLGQLPLLIKFFQDLWNRPQYSFFPLILVGASYLTWDRLQECPPPRANRREQFIGVVLLGGAFVSLLIGVMLRVRWFAGVSGWIGLAGCACFCGGIRLLRAAVPALLLLAVIMPPPMRQDDGVAVTLRQWAVWAGGHLLDVLHVPHVVSGTLINIAGRRLGVEEACSGINSLLAVVAVTLMLGLWWRRPAWRIVLVMGGSIVFVLWANVMRIVVGAVLEDRWKIDILSGSAHELLGLILFAFCIALAASLDQLILLFHREKPAGQASPVAPPPVDVPKLHGAPPVWMVWGIGLAFVALGVFGEARIGSLWRSSQIPENARFELPVTLAGWERQPGSEQVIGRPELLGQHSVTWEYRLGSQSVLVALDYPFPGYHELTTCYFLSGWSIVGEEQRDRPVDANPLRAVNMVRTTPAYAYLLFSLCDETGRWLSPPPPLKLEGYKLSMELSRETAEASQTCQVQVLAQSYEPLTDEQKINIGNLFIAAREKLAAEVAAEVTKRP
jgi:exosortase